MEDQEIERDVWILYERLKNQLKELSTKEYEKAVKKICEELEI